MCVSTWRLHLGGAMAYLRAPQRRRREGMMLLRLCAGECVGSGASHEQQ